MGPAGRVEETAPEADSVQQDSAFRLEGSNLPTPLGPTEPGLSGGTAASCGGLGTAEELHRNFAIVGAGRLLPPPRIFPDSALWGRARLTPDSYISSPTRP